MLLCNELLFDNLSWSNIQGVCCAALKQDPICQSIAAARHLVGRFKKTAKSTAETKLAEHKLTQDVSTRWNSTHVMLEHLLEYRWPVRAVLSDPSTTKQSDLDLHLSTARWRTAEDSFVSSLKPMITLTELLSQYVNASLSAMLPMLINMRDDGSTTPKTLEKLTRDGSLDQHISKLLS